MRQARYRRTQPQEHGQQRTRPADTKGRTMPNTYPKLHNAMWPGIVGKGAPDSEPIIPFDTLLTLTANARVDGARFDGIDLFITAPHVDIDSDRDAVRWIADKIADHGLKVGTFVAPSWGGAGGGSAMGSEDDRKRFL